ncbi:hypothetical protein [Chryseobacterium sp.]|uniref:hypothetical protein n=1 Tax=Chryseobacterium sp. TaxID=1871047 RepID=UPI00289D967C|nr:hypothetical protein [Chryseobacterium sp.]
MRQKFIPFLFSAALLLNLGCQVDDEMDEEIQNLYCDSSNTTFNQLYNSLVTPTNPGTAQTLDLVTHSYTFSVTSNKVICKVGYQSAPAMSGTPYLIEIYDNTDAVTVYSDSHLFSSASTSYVTIIPTVIKSGHSYTIKRSQNNYAGNIVNTIGRLITNSTFPVVHGDLKITGSSFYGTGGPLNNGSIPYIDIVFE